MTGLHYPDNLYADHEERKARRSQQPTGAYRSTSVERVRVLPLVNADLHKRVAKGSTEYGEPLTTHNGRDALWDAYEEALDLCLYLRQAIEERRQPSPAAQREAKVAYDVACDGKLGCGDLTKGDAGAVTLSIDRLSERAPKWDPKWAEQSTESARRDLRDYGSVFYRRSMQDGRLVVEHVPLETVYVTQPQHPMHAETLRDHDERLAGGEDRL